MRDRQVSKKCIPSGGIIHVAPFFNSPIVLTELFLCWDFLESSAPPLNLTRTARCVLCTPSYRGSVSHPFACLHSVKDQCDKWWSTTTGWASVGFFFWCRRLDLDRRFLMEWKFGVQKCVFLLALILRPQEKGLNVALFPVFKSIGLCRRLMALTFRHHASST